MCCPLVPAGYVLLAESLRKLVCSIESTFRLDSWLHYKSCVLLLACTCLYNYCYFRIGKMKIPSILWVSLDWLYSSAKTLIFPQLKDMINLFFFLLYISIFPLHNSLFLYFLLIPFSIQFINFLLTSFIEPLHSNQVITYLI